MKKALCILFALFLFISCSKTESTSTVTTSDTRVETASKTEEVVVASKKEPKAPAKYSYYDEYTGKNIELDTVISDNPIAVSQVATDGTISKTAFILDNKYVEAVIVTQTLTMYQNKWDSSVTDYYINCVFNFIPTKYYEDALRRTTSPTYTRKIEDKDNFKPILVTKIEIAEPDLEKEYSLAESPIEIGWMDYRIETAEGELTANYPDDCYLYIEDSKKYAEEESLRPYLYGTVKQGRNGILCYINDDQDNYFTYEGLYTVQVPRKDVPSFMSYGFLGYETKYRSAYYVTEEGYRLFDVLMKSILYDEVYQSQEYKEAISSFGKNDIGSILTSFSSVHNSFNTAIAEIEQRFEDLPLYPWDYIDPDKISQFKTDVVYQGPYSEDEYNKLYGLI